MFKTLVYRFKGIRNELAFRWMPKIADWAVWAASARARPNLIKLAPVKLLLDSTIHAHAITHEDTWIDTGVVLWGGVHPVNTGYMARVPVHATDNRTREYRDICMLTVLTSLAGKGFFSLYTSAELMAERTRHPPRRFEANGYSDLSLLDGLKIESVDGWHFDSYLTGGATTAQLKMVQQNRIGSTDDPLYPKIIRVFGSETHSQDAWHILTAHRHGMFAFVTMDYSLIRMTQRHRTRLDKLGIVTKILTPEQLGDELSLSPVPPYLFSYNNASSPVRSDLSMPNGRRRSSRKSK